MAPKPTSPTTRPLEAAVARASREASRREGDRDVSLGDKARRTRNRLLRAAYEQFCDTGYRGTQVGDIAKRAGASVGTFYQYFRSRADVMTTLVSEAVLGTFDAPEWRLDRGRGGIRELLREFIAGYEATAPFQGVWEEATHVDDIPAAVRRDLSRYMTEGLEREFRRAKRRGAFSRDVDPALLARALSAMVDRYCYLTYVFDPPDTPVPIERSIAVLEHVWSAALGVDRPAGDAS